MLKEADHISLIVSDLEQSRAFYGQLLGMRALARPGFDFEGAWFAVGGLQIHLIASGSNTGLPGLQLQPGGRPSRHLHFAFAVEDFEQAHRQVQQHDIPILDGPKRRPDGIQQLFIADPDGYVLELCETSDNR